MTADRGEKGELAREHRTYSRESIWNLQQGVSTGLIQEWFWCFGFTERIVCFNVSASRSPPGHNKISGCIFCMHYIQRGISTVAQSFPPARQYSWVHFSQAYFLFKHDQCHLASIVNRPCTYQAKFFHFSVHQDKNYKIISNVAGLTMFPHSANFDIPGEHCKLSLMCR